MEFRGGIYINQVKSDNLFNSIKTWAKEIKVKDIKYFGEKSKTELIKSISIADPKALTGIINVWCFSLSLSVGFILINIVKTDLFLEPNQEE